MKHRKTIVMPERPTVADAANDDRMRGALAHWDCNTVTITRKPAAREVYWIAAPPGSRKPEFTGYHPGVILRPPASMSPEIGSVMFVHLSSVPPREGADGKPVSAHMRQLSENPGPEKSRPVWAVCDKVMSVSIRRLEMYLERGRGPWVPRLSQEDFERVLEGVASAIVPLRNMIERSVRNEYMDAMARATRDHDLRLASLEEEILERMTRPGK